MQRIDVPTGQHHDDRWLERRRVRQNRCDTGSARGLHDQLRALEQQDQRPGQPVLVDGDNAVAQCLDQPERNVTGTGDRDPVGHGRHGLQWHRPAGVERRRVCGGSDRLHADQPYVGASVLDRDRRCLPADRRRLR